MVIKATAPRSHLITTNNAVSGSYTPTDWITRDDMALLARRSAYTVGRDVKENKLETREDDAGRVLVNVGDFIRIGRLRQQDLTLGATPAESAAVLRSREAVSQMRAELAHAQGRLDQVDAVVTTLREQLSSKDQQLAKRDDHVAQLTTLLGQLSQRRFRDATGGTP